MARKKLTVVGNWIDDRLRYACGSITPDMRFIIIIVMLLLFSAGSLYFTISSIYNFGREKGETIHVEHIKRLEIEVQQKRQEADSLKLFKNF
jgi:hypothetical protein